MLGAAVELGLARTLCEVLEGCSTAGGGSSSGTGASAANPEAAAASAAAVRALGSLVGCAPRVAGAGAVPGE